MKRIFSCSPNKQTHTHTPVMLLCQAHHTLHMRFIHTYNRAARVHSSKWWVQSLHLSTCSSREHEICLPALLCVVCACSKEGAVIAAGWDREMRETWVRICILFQSFPPCVVESKQLLMPPTQFGCWPRPSLFCATDQRFSQRLAQLYCGGKLFIFWWCNWEKAVFLLTILLLERVFIWSKPFFYIKNSDNAVGGAVWDWDCMSC